MERINLRNEDGSHFIAKIYWGEYSGSSYKNKIPGWVSWNTYMQQK